MQMADSMPSNLNSGLPSAISTPSIAFTSGIQSTGSSGFNSKLHSGQSSVGCFSVASRTSQSRTQQTVATYFRNSLIDLLTKMVACQPHFVRCVRPNRSNEVRLFDKEHVLRQLRHCGLLETIRIRQKGFSHRFSYFEFVEKYRFLLLPGRMFQQAVGLGDFGFDNEHAYKQMTQTIVERIALKNYRLGKTKLFLKHYHIATLMERFETVQRKVVRVQALVRGFLLRRRLRRSLAERGRKATTVQKLVRGYLARKHYRCELDRRAKAGALITKCKTLSLRSLAACYQVVSCLFYSQFPLFNELLCVLTIVMAHITVFYDSRVPVHQSDYSSALSKFHNLLIRYVKC